MSEDLDVYLPPSVPTANGHGTITRLSALDKLFTATGEVRVQCGKKTVALPIQSVDLELVESLCRPFKPKPKVHVELNNGRRTIVENLVDSGYQDQLAEFNRLSSYAFVCCGLLCDIEDKQGKVVWSADNTVHDLLAAKQVLKDMGIVDTQLVAILNAVSALTQAIEEEQVGE